MVSTHDVFFTQEFQQQQSAEDSDCEFEIRSRGDDSEMMNEETASQRSENISDYSDEFEMTGDTTDESSTDESYQEVMIEDPANFDVMEDLSRVMLGERQPVKYHHPGEEIYLKENVIYTNGHKEYVAHHTVMYYWELAFPHLFPLGIGGPDTKAKIKRPRVLDDASYDMHLLYESSQRFTNSMQWLCARYRYRTLRSCSRVAYRAGMYGGAGENAEPNVADVRQATEFGRAGLNRVVKSDEQIETEKLLRQLTTFGGQLKTSAMYIQHERQKLLCMLQSKHLSTPTWFLTLSSADLFWPELWMAIDSSLDYESAAKLSLNQRRNLLNSNATMACRMFKERIDCILKYILIKGKHRPFGKVVDWWFRVEFQSRGSLHVHSILWSLLHMSDGTCLNGDLQAELFRRCLVKPEKEEVSDLGDGFECGLAGTAQAESSSVCSEVESVLETKVLPRGADECKQMLADLLDKYVSASYPDRNCDTAMTCAVCAPKPNKKKTRKPKKEAKQSSVVVCECHNGVGRDGEVQQVKFDMIPRESLEHPSLHPCSFDVDTQSQIDDLCDLISAVNCHDPKHTESCWKYCKDNETERICRYNFPRSLCVQTHIANEYSERYKAMKVCVEFKRNHSLINNHSPWLLVHHRANMDAQFVCNATGAATYACMYCSKAEAPDKDIINAKTRSMLLREKACGVPDTLQKKLYLTSMAVYSSREVCMQEICWYLLGFPFVFSSRSFVKINLLPPSMHYKVLLPTPARDKLPPDACPFAETDGIHNLIKDYMKLDPTQAKLQKGLSLYDFISEYSPTKRTESRPSDLLSGDGTRYRKRKVAKIVKVTPYIRFDETCKKSCYAMLLAHRRHYTSIEQCGDFENSLATLQQCLDDNLMCESYFILRDKQRRQRRILDDIQDKRNATEVAKKTSNRLLDLAMSHDEGVAATYKPRNDDDSQQSSEMMLLDKLDCSKSNCHDCERVSSDEFRRAFEYVKEIKRKHEFETKEELRQYLVGDKDQYNLRIRGCTLTKAMTSSFTVWADSFAHLDPKQKASFHVVAAYLNGAEYCKTNTNPLVSCV